ncbi:DNA glycosylase [Arthrobacter sp. MYb229]|uniref:DNA-formamidopyrimidine glycosylase family protein n=1 Tax=unclassified Arthrobacter TaxID=235627 RepID=UPI000CFC3EF7|nr:MULTISPECIES: DNA-formamidopyrimidine glycosylase family protein [unclassified Arthrobacter]PRA03038.1 DNA glycosylase [Arthrobacter sp. MYb229]PRB49508.1 DNA glycosylase [Arthrobacter sp. MYb216]
MPEGDSVYRATARLHQALAGQRLIRSDFRVPQLATTDLAGYTVHEVRPRGKHLLMRLSPPEGSGQVPLTLHSHLLMDGRWDLYAPAERWKRPAHTARVALHTAPWTAVGFDIAQLQLVPTAEEQGLVGHLGPDLLGDNWDPELAALNLLAEPERVIEEALLDQRLLAGIGNIYRCEVLFLTRVHPLTPVGEVENLPAVISMSHRLLQLNKDRGRRVTTGDPRTREPLWVYGRAARPCLRCGTNVAVFKLAGQKTGMERDCYYCPNCQAMKE